MNMLVQGSGLSKLLSRGEVLFNACPGVSMNCVQGCKNFCHQRGCTHINWNSPIGILVFFVAGRFGYSYDQTSCRQNGRSNTEEGRKDGN